METQILKRVTKHYLSSGDFNGIPVAALISQCESTAEQIETALRALIESDQVVVIGPNVGPNPHILPFNGYDHPRQIESLGGDQNHTCVYPALESQQEELSDELFNDAPYSRELAIGHGQLMYRVFNLDVLERYRNDPRYYYGNDDISGRICIGDEFDQSDSMDDPDKVLLQTFGFAVTPDIQNRAVCVFLRYLHDLTPEHQRFWKSRQLDGKFTIHPDYYAQSIEGSWGTRIPICRGIIMEIQLINKMADAMGRLPLFRKDFSDSIPREFHLLIRPTQNEYSAFVLLLDKILSDNLNKKFFSSDLNLENEKERDDGKIVVTQKGTLQLLDEWIRKFYQMPDWEKWESSIKSLKLVRRQRQKPAHSLDDNQFDQTLFIKQRELLESVYGGLRILRLIFANHPDVKTADIEISNSLADGKIISW